MHYNDIKIKSEHNVLGRGLILLASELYASDVQINDTLEYNNELYVIRGIEAWKTLMDYLEDIQGIGIRVRKMTVKNDVQKEILKLLLNDDRFIYSSAVSHFFKTKEDEFIQLNVEHSGKSLAQCKICVHNDDVDDSISLVVELYLNSYCEWYTHFDGWIWSIDDFKFVLKALGI